MYGSFYLNDIGVKIFYPPTQMNKNLYLDLVDRLSDYYTTHSSLPDKYTFSVTKQRISTVTPNMSSVSEVFESDIDEVKSRLFRIINNIVVAAQLKNIDYFDLVVSAIYSPSQDNENNYFREHVDLVGDSFLKKDYNFRQLGAEKLTTGLHWYFVRQGRNYTLKVVPYKGQPGKIFIDLIVLFPQERVSVGEIKMLVEEEIDFLNNEIYEFLTSQMELR